MRHWPDNFQMVAVDVMTEIESINLLKLLLHEQNLNEKEEIVKLVKTLGFLPLAIAQAGAYIYESKIKVSEYLQLYHEHATELLSNNMVLTEPDIIPVTTTWNISINKLIQDALDNKKPSYAIDILMVCAYLAPEKISRQFLLTWLKDVYPNLDSHELILSNTIGQLWKYSLINANGDGYIGIHRLLQLVLRNHHKRDMSFHNVQYPALNLQWYNKLLQAIHTEFRHNKALENDAQGQYFLPHLQSLVEHDAIMWPNNKRSEIAKLLRVLGVTFYYFGDLKSAKECSQQALQIFENTDKKDYVEIAYTMNNLGYYYDEMGDYKVAKSFLENALKLKQQHPQKDDYVAVTVSSLGLVYKNLGEPRHARGLLESSLEMMKEYQGKDAYMEG